MQNYEYNMMKLGKKITSSSKKWFGSEPVFNDKYLKGKLNSYQEKTNTNFHSNEISEERSQVIL